MNDGHASSSSLANSYRADALFGEVGDDAMVGGDGTDFADGWAGTDRCFFAETLRSCP